ncbi:MAG TPA: RidA family protein [Roseiflexaceae bacterium]|mgnify:CR=1 FL=1|nr:RidA family protein [Roseiflexaceae bacterium]HMP39281.1 RidA family protein [Roseiflexaceae bacterium]
MKPLDVILTDVAPLPPNGSSQALRYGNRLVTSSFTGANPHGSGITPGGFAAEFRLAVHYLQAVLNAARCTLHDVVRINIVLTDMKYVEELDQLMAEYFHAPYPTQTVSGVMSLRGGAQVAIDVWAVIRDDA